MRERYLYIVLVEGIIDTLEYRAVVYRRRHDIDPAYNLQCDTAVGKLLDDDHDLMAFIVCVDTRERRDSLYENLPDTVDIRALGYAYLHDSHLTAMAACEVLVVLGEQL